MSKRISSVADPKKNSNSNARPFPLIDRKWTLFLDRDGVINRRKVGGYICHPDEFDFLPGVLETMPVLAGLFSRIIVLTNQQGIGKGLMTERQLEAVHRFMRNRIKEAGGRIDGVYHCPHLASEACDCRKPKAGLFLQALRDFPGIDPHCCVMVGDASSDIALAINQSWIAVGLTDRPESLPDAHYHIHQLAELTALCCHQSNPSSP
jgi:D-glycero-D-manno-heptose 1,7-bisphosphate phosphatase